MGVFCYRLSGVFKAVTPLHVGSGVRTGVIKRCRSFIPGAVLRGAVGTALIKAVCKLDKPLIEHEKCEYFDDCVYAQLFGEEFGKSSKVFFRYIYPSHLKCSGIFRPAKRTLFRCSNPQCRKIFDRFIPLSECDVCGHPVKPFYGFRCESCGELERVPVRISRITLTAIDREKNSAAQVEGFSEGGAGTLHTLEVIERGSRFCFEVIVHGEFSGAVNLLRNVLEKALPDEGIGGAKSRGLGKIVVEDLKVEGVNSSILEKRAEVIDVRRFRVKLVSPLVLGGKSLEASSLLEGVRRAYSWAFREGKPALPEIKLKHWAVGSELFSGWSLKTGKRRRLESAVSGGSVFDFECDVESRELALGLAALEYYAVGTYKPHGCGQVIVESSNQNEIKEHFEHQLGGE
jgi:CRISPR/Cas system CSM-associated protein Csm3 (group 7 of RAMP superfamily)